MKNAGIVLIIIGVLMLIFTNLNFTTEKKVIDLGPLEVNKKEKKSIGWPIWVGGVLMVAGIGLVVVNNKKS